MYFHCSARTALFSTRRKFCEFSTGFSTLTKTSKRVTLPHYHHFVITLSAKPFSRSFVEREAEKSSVPIQSGCKVPRTQRKPVQVRTERLYWSKMECVSTGNGSAKSSPLMAQAALVLLKIPATLYPTYIAFFAFCVVFFILKIGRESFKN